MDFSGEFAELAEYSPAVHFRLLNMSAALIGMSNQITSLEFVRLLAEHDRAILNYILTFIPQRNDAEEVLQRTVAVLWQKLDECDLDRGFAGWAMHRAYYEVLNFRKEHARSRLIFREDLISQLADERNQQEPFLAAQRSALRDCLNSLNGEQRSLLHRRYSDNSSVVFLAEETGVTAKSLYRRLDRLRELIADCVQRRMERSAVE